MNLDHIRRFASAQGMEVTEGESCLWVRKRGVFLESIPSHRRIQIRSAEARRLFLRGAMIIRHACEAGEGFPGFEYIWDDKSYSLDSLDRDARRRILRSIDQCECGPIDFDLLAREGCAINQSVFARQNRDMDSFLTIESRWQQYMLVCAGLPFVEAYAVRNENRISAYCLAVFVDDYCYLFHPHARTEDLKFNPMNILIYSVTKQMLGRPGVNCVSYGLSSFTPRPGLDHFKLAMGSRRRPIGRRVLINPLARPFFSGPGFSLTSAVLSRFRPGLAEDLSHLAEAWNQRSRAAIASTN